MEEIWKVYKETYSQRWGHVVWEVSNCGNVKKNGEPYECKNSGWGYKVFGSHYFLHIAVAELFIGPKPGPGYEVDHIDTNELNNHVSNLRWTTHEENMNNQLTKRHCSDRKIGEKHPNCGKHLAGKTRQKISEAVTGDKNGMYGRTGEKNPNSVKCIYDGVEFGSKKDAWNYAKDHCGYKYGYFAFIKHY